MLPLRGVWDEMARSRTLFQSFLWSHTAAAAFASRESPHIVFASSDAGMAIIPAVLRRADMGLLGETLFDYRGVISSGDAGVEDSAWSKLSERGRPLSVTAIRGDENLAVWRGMQVLPFASAPEITRTELGADELRSRHPRLGRFARRIARKGIVLHRHPGTNGKLVRTVYELKASQSATSLFADPLRRNFMECICAIEPGCEVFTYESGATLVAALVTFRYWNTRHFYTTYFDPKYSADSPGQVLLFEVAALTLEEGMDCDFMTGSSPFKSRLATRQVPLYRVECSAEELRSRATARRAA
jgi:hypothetical protein